MISTYYRDSLIYLFIVDSMPFLERWKAPA